MGLRWKELSPRNSQVRSNGTDSAGQILKQRKWFYENSIVAKIFVRFGGDPALGLPALACRSCASKDWSS